MAEECESFQLLMSGYLDGELTTEDRARLEKHLASCWGCRQEFDKMRRLVTAASELRVDEPPEEVWETFMDGVYNRIERQTGWVLLVVGAAALALFGIYQFLSEPWGPALVKLLIATPVVGLAVVFISVLRERLFAAKTDRYSKEIQR